MLHHGGRFTNALGRSYFNGKQNYVDYLDTDLFSVIKLNEMVDNGLKAFGYEKDVIEMRRSSKVGQSSEANELGQSSSNLHTTEFANRLYDALDNPNFDPFLSLDDNEVLAKVYEIEHTLDKNAEGEVVHSKGKEVLDNAHDADDDVERIRKRKLEELRKQLRKNAEGGKNQTYVCVGQSFGTTTEAKERTKLHSIETWREIHDAVVVRLKQEVLQLPRQCT
nr:hypothetical protein [Tanacetum cinerariifolium]